MSLQEHCGSMSLRQQRELKGNVITVTSFTVAVATNCK